MPLQTAKDFANAAASMREAATEFKPDDADPYAQVRKLIQFHLITAANKAREIAEALATKEAQG
jgi:hypothetical protein